MTVLNDASPSRPALANLIAAARDEARSKRFAAKQQLPNSTIGKELAFYASRWDRLADDAEREAEA